MRSATALKARPFAGTLPSIRLPMMQCARTAGSATLANGAVKNVIFDLGGVLLEWNPDKLLAAFYSDLQLRSILKRALFLHDDWRLLNRGQLSEPELIERVAVRTDRPLGELSALLDSMRESLDTKPATVALLRSLQARGIRLYCLSDMPSAVYEYLRKRHDFWDAFQGIVISAEVQLMKPEPAVFEYLLTRYQLRAAETVFIDDVSLNTEGARGSGLRAIQFQDIAQVERELLPMLS
jgi:putative hydrolase of the HAD superfamily